MKVVNAFAQVFAILAFLTLGSLLIIVALPLLSIEDAILRIREVYDNPWKSFHTGLVGILFIMVGLTFSKMLMKKGRESEALIFESEIGPIVVSVTAMEDVVRKVLKRFHVVKDWKIKTVLQGRNVKISVRFVLWSGGGLPQLLAEIQEEIRTRVKKLLSPDNAVEVACDVQRIEDHDEEMQEPEYNHDKVGSF